MDVVLPLAQTLDLSKAPSVTASSSELHDSAFERLLKLFVTEPLVLKWTHNKATLLSYRRARGTVTLRLHRAFAAAGVVEARALAAHLRGVPRQTRALQAFFARARPQPREQQSRGRLRTCGMHHDLGAYFAQLNAQYFAGQCTSDITWGRSSHRGRRRKRSMQLGCYVQQLSLIRIHPALDQAFVPDYVVQGVVFHEMLHEALGTDESGPTRRMHPPAFRARERAYPDFGRCVAWEKQHLGRLLGWRPNSEP